MDNFLLSTIFEMFDRKVGLVVWIHFVGAEYQMDYVDGNELK